MPTKIILIRHGQTNDNLKKRYTGFTDSRLNECGKRQARLLRKKLASFGVQKAFSSSSKRAVHFAILSFGRPDIVIVPQLREMNFGIFEGMTYSEIMKKYPDVYNNWIKNSFENKAPKGESFGDLKKRVLSAFRKIVRSQQNKVSVVVTHAGPIRVILGEVLKLKNIWTISPKSGGMSIIEFNKAKARVLLSNDNSYFKMVRK